MSKRVDREDKKIDRLEKENRELKSLVRQLNKRLKKLSRGYRAYLDKDIEEEKPEVEETKICWDCNRGEYKLYVIGNRRWRACTECNKRGKVKIMNE